MRDYHLHEIDTGKFETIVIEICSRILGVGVTGFSTGPDGGRDGKFSGSSNSYPSDSSPWSGTWIIQAKHTENPIALCSDRKFLKSFELEEIPKIRDLVGKGEAQNYILFTNRRKSGNAHVKLETICKDALQHENIGIIAVEDIARHLDNLPDVVRNHLPPRHTGPLLFSPQELAALIRAFTEDSELQPSTSAAQDFTYIPLELKNQLNNVTEELSQSITDDSEPYFTKIDDFLKKPQNATLRLHYDALTNEIKQKLIAENATQDGLASALADIYDTVSTRHPELTYNRRLINVFLHYMYVSCDIGRKR